MIVSHEAKKEQSKSPKTKRVTNYYSMCLLHEWTFSQYDIIITVNISRLSSTFKPAL